MGVIAEALTALELAAAMIDKFGGDSLGEMRRNYDAYLARLAERWTEFRDVVAETEEA
jgi:chorismate synthase